MSVERSFFEWVFDAFEGFAGDVAGELHSSSHRRGVKVWYDDDKKEHYEAQLIRGADGNASLEGRGQRCRPGEARSRRAHLAQGVGRCGCRRQVPRKRPMASHLGGVGCTGS